MVNARWPLPWRPLAGAACRRAECRCRCAPRLDAATTAHLSSVRALSVSLLALVRSGAGAVFSHSVSWESPQLNKTVNTVSHTPHSHTQISCCSKRVIVFVDQLDLHVLGHRHQQHLCARAGLRLTRLTRLTRLMWRRAEWFEGSAHGPHNSPPCSSSGS